MSNDDNESGFFSQLLAGLLDADTSKPHASKRRFNPRLKAALSKPMWLHLLEEWKPEPGEFVQ